MYQLGVLGMSKGRVAEQRAQRSQLGVAATHTVVPVGLQVVQEGRDHTRSRSCQSKAEGLLRMWSATNRSRSR